VFACTECLHTSDTAGSVRGHIAYTHGKNNKNGRSVRSNGHGVSVSLDVTLRDLLDQEHRIDVLTASVEGLSEDRDRWKARARNAERDLAAIRKALGPVS
jgi:hypothetical protein